MKKKNVNGKLSLKKETISKLSENANNIIGGITGFVCFISVQIPGICEGSFAAPTCKANCTAGCMGSDFC